MGCPYKMPPFMRALTEGRLISNTLRPCLVTNFAPCLLNLSTFCARATQF